MQVFYCTSTLFIKLVSYHCINTLLSYVLCYSINTLVVKVLNKESTLYYYVEEDDGLCLDFFLIAKVQSWPIKLGIIFIYLPTKS